MQAPINEASIPTENASNGPRMSGTMGRKVATRTYPWSNAAEVNLARVPSAYSMFAPLEQICDEDTRHHYLSFVLAFLL
jgi:hypothetical protein